MPEIKHMLRQKNQFLRVNKIERASSLSIKIYHVISK